jgi:hypothetical protein
MIFAREISDPLTGLVKQVNAATAKHKANKLGSFVVFLNDASIADKLSELAKKEKVEHTILGFMEEGPKEYKVAKDADVTVVLYVSRRVKANYVFKKGELGPEQTTKIMADLGKILPMK